MCTHIHNKFIHSYAQHNPLLIYVPLANTHTQAIFMIPTKPPPTLKEPNNFSNEFADFISRCLVKSPEERPSATALLQHKFIKSAKAVHVLKELVQHAMRIVEEEEDSGSVSKERPVHTLKQTNTHTHTTSG